MNRKINYPDRKFTSPAVVAVLMMTVLILIQCQQKKKGNQAKEPGKKELVKTGSGVKEDWRAPGAETIPAGKEGDEIRYGKELIAHTSLYLGPKGKVASISNGMNCQNCHNDAGTKPYGINFSAVASTYPKFRGRSASVASIAQRVNSCFERSLNGKALDSASAEMKAMISYMNWLGSNVPKGVTPENAGIKKLAYLDRAADPAKGKLAYATCEACHGKDGKGQLNQQQTEYIFPPLWGKHSYNDGAGLYRLSNFAGFVKNNMPFGTTFRHPVLSDEEAWDLAAYVNSQPRPHKDQSKDYPNISDKPMDAPVGPYADNFTERQHKYGPYQPIISQRKKK